MSLLEQSNDFLVELAKLGDTRTWEPGTTVVTEGDVADCMYIIHAGELRVVCHVFTLWGEPP